MRTKYTFALISLLLSNAAAQTVGTFTATLLLLPAIARAGVNAWTSLGPDGGGALILVVDPQSPDIVYASTGTGLFKSTDGAGSWSAMSPLPAGAGAIVSLVVDPQNSGTLYAASAVRNIAGDAIRDDASFVSKSTDGGATWRALQSGSVFRLAAPLAIDPRNSNVLYSGTYNAVLKSNAILKSNDGGTTWNVSTAGLPGTCCVLSTALAIDPNNPGNLYAGLYAGLFKSTDGGVSWREVYMYSGANKPQFRTVVLDAQNPGTLYSFDSYSGVSKSTNGGASWSTANSGLPSTRVNSLAIDSQDSRTLYAGTLSGLYKSTDGGANWQAANSGLGTDAIVAVALDPWNSGTLYVSKLNLPTSGWGVQDHRWRC